MKEYTWDEIRENDGDGGKPCLMVIEKKVYDVSKFLDEHPGGDAVLLDQGGMDATDAFENVGHSSDARKQMEDFLVGTLKAGEGKFTSKSSSTPSAVDPTKEAASGNANGGSPVLAILGIVVVVCAIVAMNMFNQA